ncbi:hypothetical protein PTKU15_12150 [Paraburkholderia terrae]|nr:hypothetical protein PTKU15_12150 [Paraburkholderia terrae]
MATNTGYGGFSYGRGLYSRQAQAATATTSWSESSSVIARRTPDVKLVASSWRWLPSVTAADESAGRLATTYKWQSTISGELTAAAEVKSDAAWGAHVVGGHYQMAAPIADWVSTSSVTASLRTSVAVTASYVWDSTARAVQLELSGPIETDYTWASQAKARLTANSVQNSAWNWSDFARAVITVNPTITNHSVWDSYVVAHETATAVINAKWNWSAIVSGGYLWNRSDGNGKYPGWTVQPGYSDIWVPQTNPSNTWTQQYK